MTSLIDTHLHLHFPDYDADQVEVMERARQGGVTRFVSIGTDVATSRACRDLAAAHPDVYATAGIHPHDVKDASDGDMEVIADLLRDPRVVGLGEVGLDFYHDHSPRDMQQDYFRRFLDIYSDSGKALVIHCRDAYDTLRDILIERGLSPYRGVMHCFSSDAAVMEGFLELGFMISFAGPLTYKKNDALREACRLCPADRLLLETDSPYLAPQSRRGKRNEPLFMTETAARAAEVRGTDTEEIASLTSRNAGRLFGL